MNTQNPKLVNNVNWHFLKTKLTNFISIILITIFYTSCSKSPVTPTPIPNYEGIYLGDIFQNGPYGYNHKYEKTNIKVFDGKLNFNLSDYVPQFKEETIVRFDLSGSNFTIIPDTTDDYKIRRIITGNGSFKNKELTIEWREIFLHPNYENDTCNFKGTLKR
jgi:hypothetical protein